MLEHTRQAELEAKYGSDKALGIWYDEKEGMSLLPDGRRAAVCTDCARFIREREPGTKIVGFLLEDNPTAAAADLAYGHDFAIVDNRYIVDPWIVGTAEVSERTVFDLKNPADRTEILRLYGSRKRWTLVEPPSEKTALPRKAPNVDRKSSSHS